MSSIPQKSDRTIRPGRLAQWDAIRDFFSSYFWFVFKNVVGWTLIVLSIPLGVTVPGPGGFPVFLIGFALVTFPGKRQLTSRVMRGRGLPIETQLFTFLTAFVAIVVTCGVMWFIADRVYEVLQQVNLDPRKKEATYTAIVAGLVVTGLFALGVTWLVMRLSLKVVNYTLKGMPFIRRRIRPWLKKHGVHLLPSRRKGENGRAASEEIIEIHERYQMRLRTIAAGIVLWAKRAIALGITVAIFVWIFRPITEHWPLVEGRIMDTGGVRFSLAAGMFAIFLFVFRAMAWRTILRIVGFSLPIAAGTRIWSTSELARYVPGFVWQVVGRAYLSRPYGVHVQASSVTQVLELAVFLAANILVALACLFCFGITNLHTPAQAWMYVAVLMLVLLGGLLHPKAFYPIIAYIMRRLGEPGVVQRLRGRALTGLLLWSVLGLLWQSVAVFIVVQEPLALEWSQWWMVAGAYCIAWCAGFVAFWAPGGLGVREVVFIGAMSMILPPAVDSEQRLALLAFLSVLLRLWATVGEIILAAAAYALDYRGALGRADAPGRVAVPAGSTTDADATA